MNLVRLASTSHQGQELTRGNRDLCDSDDEGIDQFTRFIGGGITVLPRSS